MSNLRANAEKEKIMNLHQTLRILACAFTALTLAHSAIAQTTAFTYQGRLVEETGPAEGNYDLLLSLHDSLAEGSQVGSSLTNSNVAISNGVFTTSLDFGMPFDGRPLWLEIAVRKAGEESFVPLAPRQAITPTPYALYAMAVSPTSVTGAFTGAVVFTNAANIFGGDFTGRFAGVGDLLENVNALTLGGLGTNNFWRTDGNAGTDPATNYLGTTDKRELNIRVNGITAVSIIPTRNSPSIVLGKESSVDDTFVSGSAILGGSGHSILSAEKTTENCSIGGGYGNTVSGSGNNISGGIANYLRALTSGSTIGGGVQNSILAYATHCVIAGGVANGIGGRESAACTISGGSGNTISGGFGGNADTIGGGAGNSVQPSISGGYATISGGSYNSAGGGPYATISGGNGNTVFTSGQAGTIGGGALNAVQSEFASIAGGKSNEAKGAYGTISGGHENEVNARYASVPGGANANARLHGQVAQAAGRFENNGDAQASSYICRSVTTNNVETELFLDGSGHRIEVPNNSTWTFDILVTARGTNAASAGYQLRGVIQNNDGITSFLGTPAITTLAETSYTWDAIVVADETNKALTIKVTGDVESSIRWVASVRTVEVGY